LLFIKEKLIRNPSFAILRDLVILRFQIKMVEFCPDCSGLLRRNNNGGELFLTCRCGYEESLVKNSDDIEKNIAEKKKALEENLIVVPEEEKISVHPKVKKTCSKCGHGIAEAWQEQTRSADEPSTSFFRCLKCKFTWREY